MKAKRVKISLSGAYFMSVILLFEQSLLVLWYDLNQKRVRPFSSILFFLTGNRAQTTLKDDIDYKRRQHDDTTPIR